MAEYLEKRELSYTVGENVNLCSYFTYRKPLYHMENSMEIFKKSRIELLYNPSYSISGYLSKEYENTFQKYKMLERM